MPDAADAATFWQNIIDAHVSIRDLPEGRWPGPIEHFWAEGSPETLSKTAPMRKSAPSSKASNSIGADGGNRREPSLRSILVSCGRSKWLRQPWSTQVTATKAARSTAAELAWSLPTPSAVKTATNPTSGSGRNTTELGHRSRPCRLRERRFRGRHGRRRSENHRGHHAG